MLSWESNSDKINRKYCVDKSQIHWLTTSVYSVIVWIILLRNVLMLITLSAIEYNLLKNSPQCSHNKYLSTLSIFIPANSPEVENWSMWATIVLWLKMSRKINLSQHPKLNTSNDNQI